MQRDFLENYLNVPVSAAFTTFGDINLPADLKQKLFALREIHEDYSGREQEVLGMISEFCCNDIQSKKQEIFNGPIQECFDKFDKDGSGDIDISELQNVCGQLGMELDDEQTAEAMKDLDLNGDGVIDINEFVRWYFSGMKSYSNTKRNMFRAFSGI